MLILVLLDKRDIYSNRSVLLLARGAYEEVKFAMVGTCRFRYSL